MVSDATIFIQNRKDPISITNHRIKNILWYILECHKIFIKDNRNYSQNWVRNNTTIHFEDYLKFEFIDNYLIPNKYLLKDICSELEEINFAAETQQRYIDADGKQKPDKIDICINKLGLQNEWNDADENIYFALECKRIKHLADTNGYIVDIGKFCQRNHTNLRLPFEGQIAFIENPQLSHTNITNEINKRLNKSATITTDSYLSNIKLHKTLDCSYLSTHKKNFLHKEQFSIYHLMFDYSEVVVE